VEGFLAFADEDTDLAPNFYPVLSLVASSPRRLGPSRLADFRAEIGEGIGVPDRIVG
jgi:hypothetical protein